MLGRIQIIVTCLLAAVVGGFLWYELGQREESRETVAALESRIEKILDEMDRLQVLQVAGPAAAWGNPHPEQSAYPYVGPGDEIRISDPLNPDLNVVTSVADDGRIFVPQVGWVHVAGMTGSELSAQLTTACDPYYTSTDLHAEVYREWIADAPMSSEALAARLQDLRVQQSRYTPANARWKQLQEQIERLEALTGATEEGRDADDGR